MALKVIEIQRAHGLDVSQDDVSSILKFGLVEVVYEWARGLSFKHITDLTDVLEGTISLRLDLFYMYANSQAQLFVVLYVWKKPAEKSRVLLVQSETQNYIGSLMSLKTLLSVISSLQPVSLSKFSWLLR